MDSTESKDVKNEIKILIIGNSNTGKTSFANKWTKGTFTDFYKATVVSEFTHKIYQYKGKSYRIQLWDLAGQDQNIHITKVFSKNSHGCLVLCDVTNKDTLQDTLKWKESVDDSTKFIDGDFIPAVLVQNKIDLIDEEARKDDEEIKKFAEENKFIGYFRTSVKEGIGVEECMDFLIGNILERIEKCSKEGNSNPLEKDVRNLVLEHKKVEEGKNNKNRRRH